MQYLSIIYIETTSSSMISAIGTCSHLGVSPFFNSFTTSQRIALNNSGFVWFNIFISFPYLYQLHYK